MFQVLSLSAYCPVVGHSMISQLMQPEASPMMAEQDTVYEYSRIALGLTLLLQSLGRKAEFGFLLGLWPI